MSEIGLKISYRSEWRAYAKFREKKFNRNDAQFIANKIARHFKIPRVRIVLSGYRISKANYFMNRITLCDDDFWVLCHEINHFLCHKQEMKLGADRIRHGTKKWNRNLQRLLKYCEKHNFWEEELARRNEPKPVKQEPTKDELRSQRIILLENRIKKWNGRMKFYSNKIKKANRSVAGLRKHIGLERENENSPTHILK